jgi:hypothetical protein
MEYLVTMTTRVPEATPDKEGYSQTQEKLDQLTTCGAPK